MPSHRLFLLLGLYQREATSATNVTYVEYPQRFENDYCVTVFITMADYVGTTRPVTGMGLVPETRPLLSRGESTLSTRRNRHQRLTLIGTCIQIMVTCFGLFLEMAPQTAIFQDIICNEYYKNGSTTVHMSEADCKIEPVQSQVALVNGWKGVCFIALICGGKS